ncbi:MbtH family protein [Streptomyces sp. QTS52]
MPNPFDDERLDFLVLANAEGQYSLWPAPVVVPAGWSVRHAEDTRANCLAHIAEHWCDMRPASLVEATQADHVPGGRGA